MSRVHGLAMAAFLTFGASAAAHDGTPADLTSLARGAERVVIATVTHVEPVFQNNEFGDRLIVSRTHLRVERVLKNGPGASEDAIVVEVEGGTIGDLTLDVSDLPRFERGERAVVFLGRNRLGAVVPHGRGQGVLKLDASGRVRGSGLTIAAIRQAVEAAR